MKSPSLPLLIIGDAAQWEEWARGSGRQKRSEGTHPSDRTPLKWDMAGHGKGYEGWGERGKRGDNKMKMNKLQKYIVVEGTVL